METIVTVLTPEEKLVISAGDAEKPSAGCSVNITVNMVSGRQISLIAEKSEKVGDIKGHIHELEGISLECQSLLAKRKPLANDQTLSQLLHQGKHLQSDITLTLLVTPHGPCRPGPGGEFTVMLDKTRGHRLGIDAKPRWGVRHPMAMLIEGVAPGGLVAHWNASHPDLQLKVGDRLICVNGVKDDLTGLVDQCKQNIVLEMKLIAGKSVEYA